MGKPKEASVTQKEAISDVKEKCDDIMAIGCKKRSHKTVFKAPWGTVV